MQNLIYAAPAAGVLALLFAWMKASWVSKQDPGDANMVDIAAQIQEGALAFLRAEYRVLSIFVLAVAAILGLAYYGDPGRGWQIAGSFVIGASLSAAAGWIGMKVATNANVRTTAAARIGLSPALDVAFSGGTVMGMTVVGLATIGLSVLYLVFTNVLGWELTRTVNVITGFSMGASSIALFARVGGGIYTKAADVGADLVGKVESGLPEDDPRNPAVIADNVGDNVGDVAGMGADLFESFVGAIIGAMVLALGFDAVANGDSVGPVVMPLVIAGAGIICSMVGTFFVRTKEGGNPQHALDMGAFGAAGVMAVVTFGIARYMWPEGGATTAQGQLVTWMNVGWATVAGLGAGVLVGLITSYYTSMHKGPVDSIAEQSKTGTATNIIAGLGVGMQSTAMPIIVIAFGVVIAAEVAGLYGVAIAALGMLSTTGIQLAVDAYGPIADNAGGIAEMSHQEPQVRERTDKLDAVGNTTAAIGKGFAIGSAAMTALALFAAFAQTAGIDRPASTSRSRWSWPALPRRHAPLPLLVDGDEGGRHCGDGHDRRGPSSVPRDSGPPRGQGEAGHRPLREDLHRGFAQAHGGAGRARHSDPGCRRLHDGRGAARRHARRCHRLGRDDGAFHGQRWRRLGQRQEVVRKRRLQDDGRLGPPEGQRGPQRLGRR